MITASQILVHLWGDYILQSDWMAQNKTKAHWPAAIHAITYSLTFLFFSPSLSAFVVIMGTHFLIDRYRLARYIVWAKNLIGPTFRRETMPEAIERRKRLGQVGWPEQQTIKLTRSWSECSATGYPPESPAWLSVWLLIIADNILHITINGLALRYL